jgi:hypothetical protein
VLPIELRPKPPKTGAWARPCFTSIAKLSSVAGRMTIKRNVEGSNLVSKYSAICTCTLLWCSYTCGHHGCLGRKPGGGDPGKEENWGVILGSPEKFEGLGSRVTQSFIHGHIFFSRVSRISQIWLQTGRKLSLHVHHIESRSQFCIWKDRIASKDHFHVRFALS